MIRITQTENGTVRGIASADPRVTAFRGIPFAAPPVGENRWRAPQPAADWEGVRDCFQFAPISVQDTPGLGTDIYCREWHVDPEIPMGEDCLYLNVWTPAKKTDEKLPVFLWYFGGGFQWGYTAEMEFDGENLARKGIVVVSVNYRLAALGFLAHPEISKEAPDACANFGLLDQQAGLKWVRRNIAAFGGDPDKITIGGQSAGGGSVLNQITHEGNFKDIKGAIIMSGLIKNPFMKDPILTPRSLKEAEAAGEDFFKLLGVSSLEEARKLDAFFIRDKYAEYASKNPRFAPVVDGHFAVEEPYERLANGDYADIPIMAGNTIDEFTIPTPKEFLDGKYEGKPLNIVEASVKGALNRISALPSKKPVYYYRFMPDIPGEDDPGCFHSCDLWFFFNTISKCSRPYKGRHFELADSMSSYLANFVKYGDPNGDDKAGDPLPLWSRYDINDRNEMNFTSEGPKRHIDKSQFIYDIASFLTGPKQGFNPYLPTWEYIPDGEPYVFGDRVYVYGSHDTFNGATFCPGDYVCWSASVDDLANWRYEGVIYESTQDPFNPDREMCLYAPDVTVGPDGRYYLFYVLDRVGNVSVAVCDTPAGKYKFHGYVHYPDGTLYGDKECDEPQFDPGVLTEGDKTYLYTGFCGQTDASRHGAMYTCLDSDMLTILTDAPKFVAPGKMHSEGSDFVGHAFFEAPSIRKNGDTYYFVYSSEVMHELCYATSKYPDRDFKYGGVIVSNADIGIDSYKAADFPTGFGGNNHGSIVQIKDKWYIFYHRQTNNHWFSRQGCVEEIRINADGSITQVEMTSCGSNNGRSLNDKAEYPASIACNMFSDKKEIYVGGGQPFITQYGKDGDVCNAFIKNVTEGFTFGFKYFDVKAVKGFYIRVNGYGSGTFELRTSIGGEVLGKMTINNCNIPTKFETPASIPDGKTAIYLTYTGGGTINLQSFGFIH